MDDSAANEHPSNKEHAVMLFSSAIAANVIRRVQIDMLVVSLNA
jgi:hypothetical protein